MTLLELVLGPALGTAFVLSLVLTPLAIRWRSWALMLVASLLSLALSVAAILSIGPLFVLLTCLQLAAAIALQRRVSWHGWAALLFAAVVVWLIAIPGWIATEFRVPLIAVLPVALVGAAVILAIEPVFRRRRSLYRPSK